jgi:hypothetical protein
MKEQPESPETIDIHLNSADALTITPAFTTFAEPFSEMRSPGAQIRWSREKA